MRSGYCFKVFSPCEEEHKRGDNKVPTSVVKLFGQRTKGRHARMSDWSIARMAGNALLFLYGDRDVLLLGRKS